MGAALLLGSCAQKPETPELTLSGLNPAKFETTVDSVPVKLYTLKNLTIEETAARLGTNRSYLSNAVNTYAGMSFNAYLNSLRIKASIKLLSDPACDTPIKQVAGDVGYATITSFYNNFIKETGIPPSKFRSESQNLKI